MKTEKMRILRKALQYFFAISCVLSVIGMVVLFFYYAPTFYERNLVNSNILLYGQAGMYVPTELTNRLEELNTILDTYFFNTNILAIII